MIEETHTLVLTKSGQRALRDNVIESNLTTILASVNNKSLTVRGWTVERDKQAHIGGWKETNTTLHTDGSVKLREYEMYLTVTYHHADKKPGSHDLASICAGIAKKSPQPAFGKWTLATVDGKPFELVQGAEPTLADGLVGYSDVNIPSDFEDNFEHLYGLDAHIAMIKRALEAGIISDWNHRLHCALIGPPGCGKSDICQTIKKALGEDAVLEFDATATTAAGAIKELSEREILPRVLLVEEIEKSDEKSLSFLLSVLDMRAEIRKTTARATIQRDTKLFAIATVNNYELFQKLQAGALASRFSQKIGFNRPNREQLAMILEREIQRVGGNTEWIVPTLNYCEDHDITDPRQVTAICMCGRELLLTGEYQKMMDATSVENRNEIADWTTGLPEELDMPEPVSPKQQALNARQRKG